ncbi:hypothetical protein [Dyella sp. ASV21]|uniref:hypothetical protein n=1 Tax=Dyella sp. ASV21 TaxID=2795114 RepID=UPI0018EB8F80|nr:hypothetical protein [Dyella sp. ASV21]
MRSRYRVARAQLRARHLQRQRLIGAALHELDSCCVALLGAAGAIPEGIHRGVLSEDGAYELLMSVQQRLQRAIAQVRVATGHPEDAA